MSAASQRDSLSVDLAGGANLRIALHLAEPSAASIVCLPALGVVASYYEPLAAALAANGLTAATADLRGLGESSVRPRRGVDFGYAQLVDDTARVVAALRRRVSGPLFLLGHSLGGHVAALATGAQAREIDGLILCASGTPHWRRFPARTGAKVYFLAYLSHGLGAALGYFPGKQVGFGGTEAAQLMREWGGLARRGNLRTQGFDAEHAFASVNKPVLALSLDGDWMAPRAAVDHLVSKLGHAKVTRRHLGPGDADAKSLDHFRWAKYPDAVVREILAWLKAAS